MPEVHKMPNPQLVMFMTSAQAGMAPNPLDSREMLVALGLASGDLEVNVLMQQTSVVGVIKALESGLDHARAAQSGITLPKQNGDGPDPKAVNDALGKLRGQG